MNRTAWALLILGLMQMAGEVIAMAGATNVGQAIKAVGAATTASPAPKVFKSVRGLETFSTRFTLEWEDREFRKSELALTPETYSRLRGPYNRRNVYGALVAFGPVLITNEATRTMFDAASRYALTGQAPLLRELGIDPASVNGPVRMRYEPREGTLVHDWPRVIEVQ